VTGRRADIAYVASLAVSAIILILLGVVQLRIDKLGTDDFATVWSGPRALLIGADPYDVATWTDTARRIGTHPLLDTAVYAYPPWVALALVPLALLPVESAAVVWSLAGISAAVVAVRALLRAYLPGVAWAHGLVGALLLLSAPAVVAILLGQWPFLFVTMLAAIVLLLRAHRPVAAGLVAVMMLAKPPLFVFTAAALAVRALWPGSGARDRPFVITAAAAGIAAIALSWLILPSWWPTYLEYVAAKQLTIEPVTLQTLFITLFGPNGGWLAPPVLLGMVFAALQFHPRSDGWLPVWFAVSSAGVLYSNTYDLLMLVIPMVLAAGALPPGRRALVIVAGVLLLFVVMWYLHTIYARGYAAGVSLLMFVIITAALWPQRRAVPTALTGSGISAPGSAGSSRP
jgi:hypothetical protein